MGLTRYESTWDRSVMSTSHLVGYQFRNIFPGLFQGHRQEGRRAGSVPVFGEPLAAERIEQAERIVNSDAALRKMITIVPLRQFGVASLLAQIVGIGQFLHAFIEIPVQVLFRYPAQVHVAGIHRNVLQIVETAEDVPLCPDCPLSACRTRLSISPPACLSSRRPHR